MNKYLVSVEFYIEIEAENEEQAEDIAWGWSPIHPQKGGFSQGGERLQPGMVDVAGLSEELSCNE